ncbi:MAG: alpha/beta hydrolase [Longimicrobiales bacterium]
MTIHLAAFVLATTMMVVSAERAERVVEQEEAVRLETATGVIHGTLLMPGNAPGKVAVALIIAGSGPTDRNGNSPALPGPNNSLKLLAEALAAQGIATLRYDKRSIAASMGAARTESELRFTQFSDDAAAWIAQLRNDGRFSTISVIGHSEGSLLGIMAAQKERADAFVSIAGAGRPAADALAQQLESNWPAESKTEALRMLNELRAGRTIEQVPPGLMMLFRPSVQPYMMSWLPLDPAEQLKKLDMPVLIVQGTTDVQIGVNDAERLAQAYPKGKLALLDGMNHVLKEVREASQQTASYSNPNLDLHPELGKQIGAFVLGVKAGR